MNAKKYFVAVAALNTVLLEFTASFCLGCQPPGQANDRAATAPSGTSGKFGPVIEVVLPAPKPEETTSASILDLKTGRLLVPPPIEYFNSRAGAMMGWIRSHGLDISSFVWDGGAACVTYDMTIIPVEGKRWEETTGEQLLDNPALAPGRHSPRRLLVLGPDRPDTYIFRTGDGTLGMLRIVGLGQDGQGVRIRYKLITSPKSLAVAGALQWLSPIARSAALSCSAVTG